MTKEHLSRKSDSDRQTHSTKDIIELIACSDILAIVQADKPRQPELKPGQDLVGYKPTDEVSRQASGYPVPPTAQESGRSLHGFDDADDSFHPAPGLTDIPKSK